MIDPHSNQPRTIVEPVSNDRGTIVEPVRGWWSKHALNSGLIFGLTMRGVRVLPRRVSYALGYVGTWLAWWIMPGLADAVAANLQPILPNTSVAERRRRSLKTFRSYAYDTIDFLRSLSASREKARRLFDLPEQSGEIFRRVLGEGRGGIVVTGHYANWEIGGILMSRVLDLPLTVLAMPEADPEVQRLRNQTRDMMGIETLEVRQSMATALKVRETLARNRIVAMLVDRHVGRDRVEVAFFGRQVWFLHTPALIAYLTGAPLMPCFLERVGAGSFTAVAADPIYVNRDLPRDQAIQDAMQRVAASLEARIRAKPHLVVRVLSVLGCERGHRLVRRNNTLAKPPALLMGTVSTDQPSRSNSSRHSRAPRK